MDFEIAMKKPVKKSLYLRLHGEPGERVGACSVCGESAAVNTPCLNPDGELICYRCSDDSPVFLRGVEQHLDNNGDYTFVGIFQKGEIHLWARHYDQVCCWGNNGSDSIPLTREEASLAEANPEKFIDEMIARLKFGMSRCSNCGREVPRKQLRRGHFAAMLCPDCMKKYEKRVESDRKTGDVCLKCGQPRSVCTC